MGVLERLSTLLRANINDMLDQAEDPAIMLNQILRDMENETAAMRKRYVASKRHTIQVDFDDYLYALGKERRAGAERARRQGFRLPVAPGAARAEVAA